MRVTWLTDLHLNFLNANQLDDFFAMLRRESPDLLLITGDTAEGPDLHGYLDRLTQVAPLYFVLGNHDFYRSTIAEVRHRAATTRQWLPAIGPQRLTDTTTLVGIDGWGDARCGNLQSRVRLTDWQLIGDFLGQTAPQRIETLQALGAREAAALRDQLAQLEPAPQLLVLTHVPPFAEACWYNGSRSEASWLPWFTCIAVGDVLLDHARHHPGTTITVLCGHTHGLGEHRPLDNLLVRTGGWRPGQRDYGNPVVQATWPVP
jgi:predicted phosphohydrolase